jgi:hypothetical protein
MQVKKQEIYSYRPLSSPVHHFAHQLGQYVELDAMLEKNFRLIFSNKCMLLETTLQLPPLNILLRAHIPRTIVDRCFAARKVKGG